jgi:protein-disulfide isomerase
MANNRKRFRVFATWRIGEPAENWLRERGYELEVFQGPEAPPKKSIFERRKSWIDALIAAALFVAVAPCIAQHPGSHDSQFQRKGSVEKIDIVDALPVSGEKAGVSLTASDRTLGSRKAPIMMLEYSAPTCVPCARFHTEVFPLLRKKYIDTGKVYYVFRVLPLNPVDLAAETMARCLPPSSYMQFIDVLFRNQDKWDPEFGITDVHGALVAMGAIAGMNATQIDECISNNAEVTRASQVGEDARKRYNIEGAPTFIINGQVHTGGFSWPGLQTFLDSLAKKGKKS